MSIINSSANNIQENVRKSNIKQPNITQEDDGYFVKSFAKGLAVFECFDSQDSKMTLTQVAKKIGITRAAARRFLLTLVELGYATQVQKKFSLTSKVLNLSQGFLPTTNIWETAKSHMQELVNNVDEACSAAILDGYEIEYVVRIGTPHRIMSVAPHVGTRFPAHLTSTGRAILAYSSSQTINNYIKNANYKKYTEFSTGSPYELSNALNQAKQDGYVILNQELEIGLRSIAIPLFDADNNILGALTIGTHISRVSENKLIQDILPALLSTAHDIRASLGHVQN